MMNRIRQLTNQINRTNAFVSENLGASTNPLEIPVGVATKMSKAEVLELGKEVSVVNMCYLREVVVKWERARTLMGRFISFSRGSTERACLFPVMKTLLSLGEREMRVR